MSSATPLEQNAREQARGIGQQNERSLHAALKQWYAQPGDLFEQPRHGFVVDVVRDELLIEVQTRNFSAIAAKLRRLVQHQPVKLVHPVTLEKWIVQANGSGTGSSRRKSPARGSLHELFQELVRIPELVQHPHFTLEVALIREEEVRRRDGRGSRRRKGASLLDRRLLEVVETVTFRQPQDFLRFLPEHLPQPFTSKQLAQHAVLPVYLAQKMTYCFRHMGLLLQAGKVRNAHLYVLAPEQP